MRKLARAHYRVACLRADIQHKLTTRLARQAAVLGIEDLNVAGMLKNRRLAGALADAALGELHRQLGYKAAWYGGQVVRWIASIHRAAFTMAAVATRTTWNSGSEMDLSGVRRAGRS